MQSNYGWTLGFIEVEYVIHLIDLSSAFFSLALHILRTFPGSWKVEFLMTWPGLIQNNYQRMTRINAFLAVTKMQGKGSKDPLGSLTLWWAPTNDTRAPNMTGVGWRWSWDRLTDTCSIPFGLASDRSYMSRSAWPYYDYISWLVANFFTKLVALKQVSWELSLNMTEKEGTSKVLLNLFTILLEQGSWLEGPVSQQIWRGRSPANRKN